MERHTERINGIKTELHHLSNAELTSELDYARAREDEARHDIDLLQGEVFRRYNNRLETLGETAVDGYQSGYDAYGNYVYPGIVQHPEDQ